LLDRCTTGRNGVSTVLVSHATPKSGVGAGTGYGLRPNAPVSAGLVPFKILSSKAKSRDFTTVWHAWQQSCGRPGPRRQMA
jgi:hypothetical protein